MHDPFPIKPPTWLVQVVKPVANLVNLPTIPLHIHEILICALVYYLICTELSPRLSPRLFPKIYPNFTPRTKLNWDVHVVSLVQSVFVNTMALYVMWADDERRAMGWEERVWGYTGAGGMIQGFAAGYFLWDLGICINHLDVFGWGLLAHAISALLVFGLGFRPFVNFYGPTFILYELSSPFLNFHWFFDKVQMTGSRPQWYNGILLLGSFFCCRLVWGTYQSFRVFQDVWAAIHYEPSLAANASSVFEPLGESDEVMRYAGGASLSRLTIPNWLAMVYLGSNIVLNTLNFYWFGKMVETVRSRFRDPKDAKKRKSHKDAVTADGSTSKREKSDSAGLAGADPHLVATPGEVSEGVMVEGLLDSSTVLSVDHEQWATTDGKIVSTSSTTTGVALGDQESRQRRKH